MGVTLRESQLRENPSNGVGGGGRRKSRLVGEGTRNRCWGGMGGGARGEEGVARAEASPEHPWMASLCLDPREDEGGPVAGKYHSDPDPDSPALLQGADLILFVHDTGDVPAHGGLLLQVWVH